jgi:multimeric flavodoxin WrbA
MQIVTILGSPRRHGNTAAVLAHLEGLLAGQHQVRRINVVDHKVRGCTGCGTCQKVLDEPGCKQDDDALQILHRMCEADAVVYATPLYAWSFPAQIKALIDRHYCLTKWGDNGVVRSLLAGKRAALLVTCGDAVEGNADLIQVEFARQMEAARCHAIGSYVVPHCSEPDRLGEPAWAVARALALDLCGAQP